MMTSQASHAGYLRVPLLFLLVISPIAILSSVGVTAAAGANDSTVPCTAAVLTQKISQGVPPAPIASARSLVEASASYKNTVKGYTSVFAGAGYEWNDNFTACTFSWNDYDLHYDLSATNGSSYLLTIATNPVNGTISRVILEPPTFALPVNQSSTTYSGYEIAGNSNHNTAVEYSSTYYYVPYTTATTSTCGATCRLAVWTGIQNSTYDGANRVSGSGEVIQGGSFNTEYCSGGTCTGSGGEVTGFGEFLYGDSSGVVRTDEADCVSFSMSANDEVYDVVGSGYEINGSSTSTYHVLITDETSSHTCVAFGGGLTYSSTCKLAVGTGSCKVSGTEYFADYMLETPSWSVCGGRCILPQFSIPGENLFIDGAFSTSSGINGAWTYYNDGYYQASWMENSGNINTETTIFHENSGGSSYGYFNESYHGSVGT
jgi:hypothetical protein